jgi:hypothetical protein
MHFTALQLVIVRVIVRYMPVVIPIADASKDSYEM